MANTKQARKAIRKTIKRTRYNRSWKTQVRGAYKTFMEMLKSGKSAEELKQQARVLQKKTDKAVKSRILHANKGARMKSAVAKSLKEKQAKA